MNASEYMPAPHTLRGVMHRVAGGLAGVALATGVQPVVAYAHEMAAAHSEQYVQDLRDAGIGSLGFDTNGDVPNNPELIRKAHQERDAEEHWLYTSYALEGVALLLLAGGIAGGVHTGRRQERTIAIWRATTRGTGSRAQPQFVRETA